jgi:hypothetical protein
LLNDHSVGEHICRLALASLSLCRQPVFFCAQLRSGTSWDGRKMRAGALARCSASSKPAVDTILWQHTLRFPAPREKDACACHVAGAASLGICTVCA